MHTRLTLNNGATEWPPLKPSKRPAKPGALLAALLKKP
jgi:hypothetical protein